MGRHREQPIKNTFIAAVMKSNGWNSLQEMHEATDIPYMTLKRYADNEPKESLKNLLKEAEALKMDPGEWLKGLLSAC